MQSPGELRGAPPVLNDSVQANDFQIYEQIDALAGATMGL
jgi:hypothetical protein